MVEHRGEALLSGHDLVLKARRQLRVCGVKEILRFDDTVVTLDTVCGEMTIEGEQLHINTLSVESGVIELDGLVNGMYYAEESSATRTDRRGLLARLFS